MSRTRELTTTNKIAAIITGVLMIAGALYFRTIEARDRASAERALARVVSVEDLGSRGWMATVEYQAGGALQRNPLYFREHSGRSGGHSLVAPVSVGQEIEVFWDPERPRDLRTYLWSGDLISPIIMVLGACLILLGSIALFKG